MIKQIPSSQDLKFPFLILQFLSFPYRYWIILDQIPQNQRFSPSWIPLTHPFSRGNHHFFHQKSIKHLSKTRFSPVKSPFLSTAGGSSKHFNATALASLTHVSGPGPVSGLRRASFGGATAAMLHAGAQGAAAMRRRSVDEEKIGWEENFTDGFY